MAIEKEKHIIPEQEQTQYRVIVVQGGTDACIVFALYVLMYVRMHVYMHM